MPAPESFIAKRLGLAGESVLAVVSAPDGYVDGLVLPDGVRVRTAARGRVDALVFFATRRAELARRLPAMARAVGADGALWIAWPRRTSGVATDLTDPVVRDLAHAAGFEVAATGVVDAGWSGFRLAPRVRARVRAVS